MSSGKTGKRKRGKLVFGVWVEGWVCAQPAFEHYIGMNMTLASMFDLVSCCPFVLVSVGVLYVLRIFGKGVRIVERLGMSHGAFLLEHGIGE